MLPLSQSQTIKASTWLRDNYGEIINEYTRGTPWNFKTVAAIACQETAQRWLLWIDKYSPEEVLSRCVFDASGDYPGTRRYAFPQNRNAFAEKYGVDALQILVGEANLMRRMPQPGNPDGYSAAQYLYKGYGIFQFDLQNITVDPDFFLQKKWYNMSDCLQRLIDILNAKANTASNLHGIFASYNGNGLAADLYADNVMTFRNWIK